MWKQLVCVTGIGIRSIPSRWGTASVVVIGIAMVVTVFTSVLAMARGFEATMRNAGDPHRVLVLRSGAESEAASEISFSSIAKLRDLPGVDKAPDGTPLVSAEAVAFVPLMDERSGLDSFVTLRGIEETGRLIRPEIHLIEGRWFEPSAQEVVVGKAVASRLRGAKVGDTIALPEGDWKIVGLFESGGDAKESEILTGAQTLAGAYKRKGFNSVALRMAPSANIEEITASIAKFPELVVDAHREDIYVARSASLVNALLRAFAYGLGGVMAFGAAFGAINTMLTAIARRSREIGTLRALGFHPSAVVFGILAEAMLLACVGAALGVAIVWILLDGSTVSTLSGNGPVQVAFELELTLTEALAGAATALVVGAIGGAIPGWHAGKQAVVQALRA